MKTKHLLIGIIVLILIGAGFFVIRSNKANTVEVVSSEIRTFTHSELGIEFGYKVGANGYVLEEAMPSSIDGTLERIFVLIRREDDINRNPEAGEGPAVMSIQVFKNPKMQSPRMWADENMSSNINLMQGAVTETTVFGEPAIRYMADGLYASENAVITFEENVYVVTGQFIDANSDIRRDFSPLLDSIRFIPQSVQE